MRKVKTHLLNPRGLRDANDDFRWSGFTMCGLECGGQHDVVLSEGGRHGANCRACLRGENRRVEKVLIGVSYFCPICDKHVAKSPGDFENHMRRKHPRID